MKVSQNWLKKLVEINSTPEDLSEKLSIGGFEVESLEDCSKNVKGVVLGKVLTVLKHEESKKLSICQVDVGNSKNLQIICGASNIKPNIYVYIATVGAELNAVNLTIKRSEIRGVLSEGMICSLQELGIEDSSDGIAIIDEELASKYVLGTPASKFLGLDDFVYDLAITANRPDGMSVIGIAREISALLETKLNFPELNNKYSTNLLNDIKLCPEAITSNCLYTITSIDGVNGDKLSPRWLKDRIEKSGIKSINLIVDITNYILLEQGQPLHAFDKDKLSNLIGKEVSSNDFSVRKATDSESLVCLDGNKYDLNNNITVITCSNKPVAIAGVIGGLETSVSTTTSSIYLEGAVFNPVTIRKSSKEIGIRTESSSRYEKGISSKNTINSITRAINILEEFFGINLPTINTSSLITNECTYIKLRRNRIHKILGPIIINDQFDKRNLSDSEIVDKLTLIGCNLKNKEYGWDVAVIPNRSQDLIREIDLIEEISRLIGYDRFDLNLPSPIKPGKLSPDQLALRKIKNGFMESGFNEVLSYSLVPEDNDELIRISNPLLKETSCLRNNIWKEHLHIVNRNFKAGQTSCYVFEIGNVFFKSSEFIQKEILNGAIFGNRKFGNWANSSKDNYLNYYQARGKLKEALSCLNIKIDDKPINSIDFLHPGRSAQLFIEGKDSGYFGEVHPKLILEKKALKNTYLFSLNLANLLAASTRKNKWIPLFKQYPTVPKMERDINFIFNKKYLISEITSEIKKTGKNLLEDVNLIDVFEDINLGEDSISYTFRLSYRDKDKTLLDSDISQIHTNIISKVEKRFNTKLRN
ncbi:phenylalanine--tRNA ligase subunit beta [Prochlorococcus marinus str. MU1404]|uniref:phenylalanine--tRNA ligase subunit beta n=1 Tax=Prochlorococcus marinus TaxID=1219 RepID=UPI001ADA363A|nr:phenylalanine--tRNA ligase subunit beta [Prochlorococcus marinus]MBO8230035.1 phenylalanine--tRNA ligase subunit beta [Prochlorococcus marinus XMU1404]MBW3073191.1 phenylalanine--tRNA ligase subunit beta [Prochlorococcus marinus str. MU1404]MCR8545628.1 phenylalanine--tRNA ligase subunit beta [Prochlorococcus marinus CUG1432]